MTNPTYAEIEYDVGDARNITDGSTAIKSFITKAQKDIKGITGTTTGNQEDLAIRNVASAYTVNAIMGGLGPESVNDKNYEQQKASFLKDADRALRVKGKSLDYHSIQFSQVNP